jgi:hypothetical protein
MVAGTLVITVARPGTAVPIALWPPPDAVELAVLPDVVPLDVDERAAIELFLRRQSTLGPARANELATILMAPVQKRFGFRLEDPARTLALLYDRAVNVGRTEGPSSLRGGTRAWTPAPPPYERRL